MNVKGCFLWLGRFIKFQLADHKHEIEVYTRRKGLSMPEYGVSVCIILYL